MQHRLDHHASLARRTLAALLVIVASAGCGGSTSEPTKAPAFGRQARIVVVGSPATTGGPLADVGDMVVRVEDAEGRGVPFITVKFESRDDVGLFGLSPARSATDSTGLARTTVKFNNTAGPNFIKATATGVATPARVDVTVSPGPADWFVIRPEVIRLFAAGDEATFQAYAVDRYDNPIAAPVDVKVSDPTLVSVAVPTSSGASGTVRALKGGGTATLTLSAAGQSNLLSVSVFERARTACAGVAAPQDLSSGVPVTASDSVFCIAPTPLGAEYAMIAYNSSTVGASTARTTVTAYNVLPELLVTRVPGGSNPPPSRSTSLFLRANTPTQDLRFHERLRTQSRSLRRLFSTARAVRVRGSGTTGRISARPLYSLGGAVTSTPQPNDLITLNVSTDACSNPDLRTFRVEALGTKAIVLADTSNPISGFTSLDYQRFASRFDTLVFPLDRDAFGEPSDIDGNGRIAILFTRAVNELTPAGSGSFIGGFFHPRDLFPRMASPGTAACATSNEGEMFYMLVPDPTGRVNGNVFTRGMVDTLTTGVLAHEFQHLINASRRMYVNAGADDFEETWLDEGLSHVAEELLYFKETGYTPRSFLAAQAIIDSRPHFDTWIADDASNFVRFYLYLRDPANHSPIDAGDALETRGATWSFLRYAVDRSFLSDAGVWQRFTNSTTTGLATLALGLQRDPKPLLRDFAVANLKGAQPSWNYADVFAKVFVDSTYPIPFARLKEATAVPVFAKGGSAGYYKFSVPPDAQTLLKFGSSDAPMNGDLTFMILRTR